MWKQAAGSVFPDVFNLLMLIGPTINCSLSLCVCSEWYGYHFPELIKIVSDNATYCKVAKFIGNRKELSEESLEGLEELTMDGAKAQAVLEASRSSMGTNGFSLGVETFYCFTSNSV